MPRRAYSLRGHRQAVAGGVAREEDAVVDGVADLVRDPVALVADCVLAEVRCEPDRRILDVVARVERADADPQLVVGREAPAVAGRDVRAVDPELEVGAGAV